MTLKKKFCPKCGREADKIFDGMCAQCLFEKKRKVRIPSEIVVNRCKHCGKYFSGKRASNKIRDILDPNIRKIFRLAKSKEDGIKSMNYRIGDGKVYVSLKYDFNGIQKSEEHEIDIIEKLKVCHYCAIAGTRYYNAILQIRAPEEKIERIVMDARSRIAEIKSDRMAFISEVKKVRNGADMYIGSKAAAKRVARAIKRKFNAETKLTRKLAGRKMGKKVYRDTILILIE
jgi:nonsense-mediated mRNA decay protein 3